MYLRWKGGRGEQEEWEVENVEEEEVVEVMEVENSRRLLVQCVMDLDTAR